MKNKPKVDIIIDELVENKKFQKYVAKLMKGKDLIKATTRWTKVR